jgi:hypothetical protein
VTPGLLVVLIILTVYRATRFVIEDTFPPVGVPRTHLINWWAPDGEWIIDHPNATPHWGALGRSLRYLFQCPWCMSMWIGAAIIWVLQEWFVSVPLPVLVWAAASALTGILASLEEKLSA